MYSKANLRARTPKQALHFIKDFFFFLSKLKRRTSYILLFHYQAASTFQALQEQLSGTKKLWSFLLHDLIKIHILFVDNKQFNFQEYFLDMQKENVWTELLGSHLL